MAENGGTQPEAEATTPQPPKMQILGQFIRDFSFENIMVQKGVGGEVTPEISVQVSLDAKKRKVENQFEVISKYSITSAPIRICRSENCFTINAASKLSSGGEISTAGAPFKRDDKSFNDTDQRVGALIANNNKCFRLALIIFIK